jgi:hypothetical protein
MSLTSFKQPSVHPQEDMCLQLYGIFLYIDYTAYLDA